MYNVDCSLAPSAGLHHRGGFHGLHRPAAELGPGGGQGAPGAEQIPGVG